jgi:hypothetical protein
MQATAPIVAAEWMRRVEAEYRSAALTANLAHWLLQVGASHDLVRMALSIVDDELVHAELSSDVVEAALADTGLSRPTAAPLARDSLGLERRWEPLELDVAATCVEGFCLGETIAVPLFVHMRELATAPAARVVLGRIVIDEVRHRDFGWLLFEWLLAGREGALVRRFIERELPAMCARLAASYGALADERTLPAGLEHWGMMPGAEYARALGRTARREWLPRLRQLGFDGDIVKAVEALLRFETLSPETALPE